MKQKIFKKAILASMIVFASQAFADSRDGIIFPYGFQEIESFRSVRLFVDENANFVEIVDISAGAELKHKTFGYSNGRYLRNNFSINLLDRKGFSLINGGFFDFGGIDDGTKFNFAHDYRKIMFPFTPGNTVWNSSENTRTLCIKDNNRAVVDNTGYNKRDYSKACKFSITLLHPSVSKDRNSKIGRSYIGVSKDNTKVLFFVSHANTQTGMEKLIKSWGIPDYHIIMGDGSGSAQLFTRRSYVRGSNIFGGTPYSLDGRSVPHMIQVFPY